MRYVDKDAEYLDEVMPEADGPFAHAVRTAFAQVHDLREDKAIAKRLDMQPPSLSKALKGAATMNAKTLRKILGQFESFVVRQRIAEAWQAESFASDLMSGGGPARESGTSDDVAKLIDEKRPRLALRLAIPLLNSSQPPEPINKIIEQAIYLAFRLDDPMAQVEVADRLRRAGEESRDKGFSALSLAVSARTLRRSGAHLKAMTPLWDKVVDMTAGLPAGLSPSSSTSKFARDMVESEQLAAIMDEHRFRGGFEDKLTNALKIANARTLAATTPQGARQAKILEASIYLCLGSHFKAEEILESAYGDSKGIRGTAVYTALLYGRILAAKGETEEATDWYRRLLEACIIEQEVFLQRLATQELALLLVAANVNSP